MEEQPLSRKVIDDLPWYLGYSFVLLRHRKGVVGVALAISLAYGTRRYLILHDHESPEYATELLTPSPLRFAKGFCWAFFRLGAPMALAWISDP